jgi:hypothetical protein
MILIAATAGAIEGYGRTSTGCWLGKIAVQRMIGCAERISKGSPSFQDLQNSVIDPSDGLHGNWISPTLENRLSS